MSPPTPNELQAACLQGQQHLMSMEYLRAEAALLRAESLALQSEDWDTLSRLYMPLQEARRQRRQRCGEGLIKLDIVAQSADDVIDPAKLAQKYPHGQLLIAGFGSIEPAKLFRKIALDKGLYVETFLAAVYPIAGGGRAVAVVPTADVTLPPADEIPIDLLIPRLPPHSIVLPATDLPGGERAGDAHTFAQTMSLWERLHLPFVAMADSTTDLRRRIMAYRKATEVDYACELAHQKLSDASRQLLHATARGH